MGAVQKNIPVGLFGARVLLDSFFDQSSRDILSMLSLRVRLGRLEKRTASVNPAVSGELFPVDKDTSLSAIDSCGSDQQPANSCSPEFDTAFRELSNLYPKVRKPLSVLELLSKYVRDEDMAEDLQIRAGIHRLLCSLFSDLLSPSKSNDSFRLLHKCTSKQADDACRRMRSLSLSSYSSQLDHSETNHLWTLIRPGRDPRELLQMFLTLSAQAAQLQRSHADPDAMVAVGSQWYALLADLCVQLGLSTYEFGDWTLKDIHAASKLFESSVRERSGLYSVLWDVRNKEDIKNFDANWMTIQKLIKGLGNPQTAENSTVALYESCSPHSFCNKLCVYFTAVLDFLEPPTLDYYTSISQAENLPYGFFNTPNNVVVNGLPNNTHIEDADEDQTAKDTNIILLDPFSPRAQHAISYSSVADNDASQSPSERVAQAHAYNMMSLASDREPTSPLATLPDHKACSGSPTLVNRSALLLEGGDEYDSDESDIEMSPSRHASSKRQKSNDHILSPSNRATPRRGRHGRSSAEGMDIDSSVILGSPSAMLSAKHDKRMRNSVLLRTQAPPALSFGPVKNRNPSLETTDDEINHPPANSSSAMTTPKAQTGEKMVDMSKYVADRAYGDVEGGGRPHRRRHNTDVFGTPNAVRSAVLEPPPQTLLSPKNIAAARHKNIELESLVAQYKNYEPADSMEMELTSTPQRPKYVVETLRELQTTPENQVGQAADAQASSVSRYVKRKDQGDIEGGGRKHRNRQRSGGYDPLLLYMGS